MAVVMKFARNSKNRAVNDIKTSTHRRETFFAVGLLLLFLSGSGLTLGWCVLHLRVGLGLLLGFLRLLGFLLSLALGLLLSTLLGELFLLGLQDSLTLSIGLLLVTLDDGAGNEADIVHLGDVNGLGGVLAVFVEPVLSHVSIVFKYW